MGLIKHKNFFIGIIASLIMTSMSLLIILLLLSEVSVEETLAFFYYQNRLGGLISLAALVNLPAFFIAIRNQYDTFAMGILLTCIVLVIVVGLLKLNSH